MLLVYFFVLYEQCVYPFPFPFGVEGWLQFVFMAYPGPFFLLSTSFQRKTNRDFQFDPVDDAAFPKLCLA